MEKNNVTLKFTNIIQKLHSFTFHFTTPSTPFKYLTCVLYVCGICVRANLPTIFEFIFFFSLSFFLSPFATYHFCSTKTQTCITWHFIIIKKNIVHRAFAFNLEFHHFQEGEREMDDCNLEVGDITNYSSNPCLTRMVAEEW